MPLPQEFIEELKARSSIEDVVSSYVSLKRRGRTMVGLCPFHSEKTPSFTVYPDNGSFYCFGCGAGGDIITFIEKIENLDYMEAVRSLAQRAGMAVPESEEDRGLAKLRMRLYALNRDAARFYHRVLLSPQGAVGMEYFSRRALTRQTITHFGLGYAPPSRFALVDYLHQKGYSDQEMIQANTAFSSRNGHAVDRFHDRVMFPIIDLRGNVVAFGGRVLGQGEPKYLNTSDTPIFSKGRNLFALNFAKDTAAQGLILCEGYMDVIALHQAGFQNAVAGLGTALTPEQARLIAHYTGEVIASYDADTAGQRAASRSIPLLRQAGLNVRILVVPDGKDPDEFIRSHGENGHARFQQLLDSCGNDVEYRLQKLKKGIDLKTPDGKIQYLNAAAEVLAALDNEIEREVYAGRLAEEAGIQRAALLQQVQSVRKKKQRRRQKKEFRTFRRQSTGAQDRLNPDKYQNLRAARAEEELLGAILDYPENAAYAAEKLSPEKWITAFNRRVYTLIVGKMKDGKAVGLTDLVDSLSQDEMGKVAGYCARHAGVPAGRPEVDSYIRVLLEENDKQNVRAGSDSDISRYLQELRAQKK
ncbi:DNA primase [Ruminococcaceae bacterium CPB6]|jgi:DNA primase|uniref:DNA primase n=1 Tax=Caproicibacterium lactatifermentans TaxID=2666138 RepID=A0A859DRW3_9FIRM|nr:DNA primase [Caproicibacterium lactatifermentans]ARP49838.1 DNA primase [Ruminococcaceae bacterium CPB6]MDD4807214.1 DNA primase [Oscillospiraceae bacterium]QKN24436.1 DNA primase [Caproicibacterium lactatifermentans]